MIVATIPLGRRYDMSRIFPGYSERPKAVDDQIIETEARSKEAASNQPLIPALIRLQSIVTQFSTKNWDGYGALPVSEKAYKDAEGFIFLLSDGGLPMPDISPEVDGGIEMEWYKSAAFVFTVSINGNGVLGYSGFYGEKSRKYGTEPSSLEIPETIHRNISKFI